MKVTTTKIDNYQEEKLLMALVVSPAVLKELAPSMKPDFFFSSYSRHVARLCLEYWGKYRTSPGKHIFDFLADAINGGKLDKTTGELVAKHLDILREHWLEETEIDPAYMIDVGKRSFGEKHWQAHFEEVEMLRGAGQVERALELAARYQPLTWGGEGKAPTLEKALSSPDLVMPFNEFAALKIPARRFLIYPWLKVGDIVLVSGAPGVGKTHFLMEAAGAASQGRWGMGTLWDCGEHVKCLYIDGELPQADLQERGKLTGLAEGANCILISKLHLESAGVSFNLADEKDREMLGRFIVEGGFELVFLDNLFSLFVGIDLKDDKDWGEINNWLLKLRAKGVAVVICHHVTKAGDQYGSRVKEFNITTSLLLKDAKEPGEETAAFTIKITKQRELGLNLEGKRYQFDDGEWLIEEASGGGDYLKKQVAAALVAGEKQINIAREIGRGRSWISQLKTKLLADGIIEGQEGSYIFTIKGNNWFVQD